MRRSVLAVALLISTSAAALAQNLDNLTAALEQVPVVALSNPVADQLYFVDVGAALGLPGLAGETLEARHFNRLQFRSFMLPAEAMAASGGDVAAWSAKSGVAAEDVRYLAGLGQPPNPVTFWGLADEAAATTAIDDLGALGFAETSAGVFGNGEPMRFDPSKIDRVDPWRSGVGAAQFVGAKGAGLVQAANPEAVAALTAPGDGMASSPIIETALAGLEQSAGDGWIVQAMVISPVFGLGAVDPGMILSPGADMDTMRKQLEAQAAAASEGIPPYFGGIVADVQLDTPALAIALAYPDCTIAQTAADAVAARWGSLMSAVGPVEVTTNAVSGAGELCAATIVVETDYAGVDNNPALQALYMAFIQRQPSVLQIGAN